MATKNRTNKKQGREQTPTLATSSTQSPVSHSTVVSSSSSASTNNSDDTTATSTPSLSQGEAPISNASSPFSTSGSASTPAPTGEGSTFAPNALGSFWKVLLADTSPDSLVKSVGIIGAVLLGGMVLLVASGKETIKSLVDLFRGPVSSSVFLYLIMTRLAPIEDPTVLSPNSTLPSPNSTLPSPNPTLLTRGLTKILYTLAKAVAELPESDAQQALHDELEDALKGYDAQRKKVSKGQRKASYYPSSRQIKSDYYNAEKASVKTAESFIEGVFTKPHVRSLGWISYQSFDKTFENNIACFARLDPNNVVDTSQYSSGSYPSLVFLTSPIQSIEELMVLSLVIPFIALIRCTNDNAKKALTKAEETYKLDSSTKQLREKFGGIDADKILFRDRIVEFIRLVKKGQASPKMGRDAIYGNALLLSYGWALVMLAARNKLINEEGEEEEEEEAEEEEVESGSQAGSGSASIVSEMSVSDGSSGFGTAVSELVPPPPPTAPPPKRSRVLTTREKWQGNEFTLASIQDGIFNSVKYHLDALNFKDEEVLSLKGKIHIAKLDKCTTSTENDKPSLPVQAPVLNTDAICGSDL